MKKVQNSLLFSIICPIYNAEKSLVSAIKSILKQDYLNWELILVDDGSTDSSPLICDCYCKGDSRIKVIHKPNEGQAKARFEGVLVSNGDYLLFLDSDDQYEPNALSILKNKISNTSLEAIVYNAVIISDTKRGSVYEFDLSKVDCPMVECFGKRRVSYLWSICFKKDFLLNIDQNTKDTFFRLSYSEDFYLIYNVIKNVKCDRFGIIDEKLYRYIYNESSITKTQNASKLVDRFYVFNNVYNDIYRNYPNLYKLISESDKDVAGWTYLSAARKIAVEYDHECYLPLIKQIRTSFLFRHMNKFKKDKYNMVGYILLKLKMYKRFRKYIIKKEGKAK